MTLKKDLWDSLKYTSSGLTKVILIGLMIIIIDQIDELSWIGTYAIMMEILLVIISFILAFMVMGYIFRIIEETVKGSNKPPKFNKFKQLFVHGINEIIVAFIYAFIPLTILFFITGNFDILGVKDSLFMATNFSFEEQYIDLMAVIAFILSLFLDLLLVGALLNMAYHNGSIRSGFDFKRIFQKIRKIGLVKLFIVYFFTIILFFLDWFILTDSLTGLFPIWGLLISQLLISPFILIFTVRLIGLIDEPIEEIGII